MSDYGKVALTQWVNVAKDVEALQNISDIDLLKAPMKNYELDPGTIIARFDTLSDWSVLAGSSGTATEDNKHAKLSNKSVSINITTPAAYVHINKTPTGLNLNSSDKRVSLWVYFGEDKANISSVTIYLYTSTSPSKYFYAAFYPTQYHKGWNLLVATTWQSSNTPDWANDIVRIGIRVVAATAKTCSVTVDDMRLDMAWQPKIIFRFDDGLSGVVNYAFPYLASKGMRGITYAIPDLVDASTTGYAILAELQTAYAAGHDIGNHTKGHVALNTKTYAETLTQIKDAQDWLIQNGFYRSARHFCVPNGQDTDFVQQVLDDIITSTSTNSLHEMYPPCMDVHKIPAEAIYNTTTVADVTAWIDSAVASGRTLVLMFHNIVDGGTPTEYEWLLTDFQAVVDYIDTNAYTKYVVTMSEFYEGLNR